MTLAQSPLKLAQTLSHISRRSLWETSALSVSVEKWCISEFFTFAWQPTDNWLPNSVFGRRLSEHWQDIQIGALKWFISFSAFLSMCWRFHVRLTWCKNVIFWHFDCYHSENNTHHWESKQCPFSKFTWKQCTLTSFSIPEQGINHPKQHLTSLLDRFLSNWLSVWLAGFLSVFSGKCEVLKQWSRSW